MRTRHIRTHARGASSHVSYEPDVDDEGDDGDFRDDVHHRRGRAEAPSRGRAGVGVDASAADEDPHGAESEIVHRAGGSRADGSRAGHRTRGRGCISAMRDGDAVGRDDERTTTTGCS